MPTRSHVNLQSVLAASPQGEPRRVDSKANGASPYKQSRELVAGLNREGYDSIVAIRAFLKLRLAVIGWLLRLIGSSMLVGLLFGSVGCSSHKDVEWTEETRLSSGKVIVAERSDHYRRVMDVGAGFQVGWLYERGSIRASLPAPISRTIQWEGTLQPILLDVFGSSTVYLVGVPGSGAAIEEWELLSGQAFRDDQPYVVFRLDGDKWNRIRLEQLPTEAKPNLLANTRSFFDQYEELQLRSGSRIDLSTKLKVDANPRLARDLTTIVRPAKTSK